MTKLRLLYLKTQLLQRRKHFIQVIKTNRFMFNMATVAVCFQINQKHMYTVWAESQFLNIKVVGASSEQQALKVNITMLCLLSTQLANSLSIREQTRIPRNSINRVFFVVDIPWVHCEVQIEYLKLKKRVITCFRHLNFIVYLHFRVSILKTT